MTGLARNFFGRNGEKIAKGSAEALGITPLGAVQGNMPRSLEKLQTLPSPTQSNVYQMQKLASASAQSAQNMELMVKDAEQVISNMVKMHQLGAKHQGNAMKASKKMAEISAAHQIDITMHGSHILQQHAKVEGVHMAMQQQRRQALYGS
jgi:hypothetical protein